MTLAMATTTAAAAASGTAVRTVGRDAHSKHGIGPYIFVRTVGRGTYATVKLATHTVTRQQVAVKIIDKSKLPADGVERLHREVVIVAQLDHPYIVKFHEVIETPSIFYMVFDYAVGGELYDVICVRRFSEPEARGKFYQLISAILYCHSRGIIHRDLKSENILLDSQNNVRVADFGLAGFFDPQGTLKVFCGSPFYAAPEVLRGVGYVGPEIDVWSLGVILYSMVTSSLPFAGANLAELTNTVVAGRFMVPDYLSPELQSLLRALLVVDPTKRASLRQFLDHPWLNVNGSANDWLLRLGLPPHVLATVVRSSSPIHHPKFDTSAPGSPSTSPALPTIAIYSPEETKLAEAYARPLHIAMTADLAAARGRTPTTNSGPAVDPTANMFVDDNGPLARLRIDSDTDGNDSRRQRSGSLATSHKSRRGGRPSSTKATAAPTVAPPTADDQQPRARAGSFAVHRASHSVDANAQSTPSTLVSASLRPTLTRAQSVVSNGSSSSADAAGNAGGGLLRNPPALQRIIGTSAGVNSSPPLPHQQPLTVGDSAVDTLSGRRQRSGSSVMSSTHRPSSSGGLRTSMEEQRFSGGSAASTSSATRSSGLRTSMDERPPLITTTSAPSGLVTTAAPVPASPGRDQPRSRRHHHHHHHHESSHSDEYDNTPYIGTR